MKMFSAAVIAAADLALGVANATRTCDKKSPRNTAPIAPPLRAGTLPITPASLSAIKRVVSGAAKSRRKTCGFVSAGLFCLITTFSGALPAQAQDADRLQARLDNLRSEHAAGQLQLQALDDRRNELGATLLRIAGAIQVLEELLAELPQE